MATPRSKGQEVKPAGVFIDAPPADDPETTKLDKVTRQALPTFRQAAAMALPDARGLVITDQDSLDRGHDLVRGIKAMLQRIGETFDPQIDAAHKLHKWLLGVKARYADPLTAADKLARQKVADYLAEQDRQRQEAARLQALAEQEARRRAEVAVDRAHDLVTEGKPEEAAQVVEDAHAKVEAVLAAAPALPAKPVVEGTSWREDWDIQVTHPELVPREYLVVDEVMVRRVVRAKRGQVVIPGVTVIPKRILITRG